jgi:hypothetical protein
MTGFTLPSGASIDEDNGDFVIKDSSGTVVLRRNESAGEWQLGGTDLTGIGSVSAGDISVGNDPQTDSLGSHRLTTKTPSGVSDVAFTNGVDNTYIGYTISISGLAPTADDVSLHAQVSADGGATWEASANAYQYVSRGEVSSGNTNQTSSKGDSKINITNGIGNASGRNMNGWIELYEPANPATHPILNWQVAHHTRADLTRVEYGSAVYQTAESVDAIRLQMSSGDISTGTLTLKGGTQ